MTTLSTYQNAVLADSPLCYWKLGDTNTTATDYGSAAKNGTYSGGYTQSQPALPYIGNNNSTLFDGSSGLITFGAGVLGTVLSGLTNITVECLVKVTGMGTSNREPILSILSDGTDVFQQSKAGIVLERRASNAGFSLSVNGNQAKVEDSATSISAGNIYHVCGVITYGAGAGRTITLYRNGAFAATLTNANIGTSFVLISPTVSDSVAGYGAGATANGNSVLSDWGLAGYLNATVSDVAIYNAAFSAAQVKSHYAASQCPFVRGDMQVKRPFKSSQKPLHHIGI